MSLWLVEKAIMVSPKSFNDEILFRGSSDLESQMLGITKSKFDTFTIFNAPMEGHKSLYVHAMLEDGSVSFPELGINHIIGRGDYVAYRSELVVDMVGDSIKKKYGFSHTPRSFGTGEKLYEITATIRDDYKISIYANSEQEALDTADGIDIAEWRHPDVQEDAHLTDRRIVRHARWGNLSVNEIKD
jgi:hypothetical protein